MVASPIWGRRWRRFRPRRSPDHRRRPSQFPYRIVLQHNRSYPASNACSDDFRVTTSLRKQKQPCRAGRSVGFGVQFAPTPKVPGGGLPGPRARAGCLPVPFSAILQVCVTSSIRQCTDGVGDFRNNQERYDEIRTCRLRRIGPSRADGRPRESNAMRRRCLADDTGPLRRLEVWPRAPGDVPVRRGRHRRAALLQREPRERERAFTRAVAGNEPAAVAERAARHAGDRVEIGVFEPRPRFGEVAPRLV